MNKNISNKIKEVRNKLDNIIIAIESGTISQNQLTDRLEAILIKLEDLEDLL